MECAGDIRVLLIAESNMYVQFMINPFYVDEEYLACSLLLLQHGTRAPIMCNILGKSYNFHTTIAG